MLALFFLFQDAPAQPATTADWAVSTQTQPKNSQGFDPKSALYETPNICVVSKGQPLPACAAQTQQTSGPMILNDQINENMFGTNIGGNAQTCQTIETIRQNTSGTATRVYATYCGDDLMSNDFHNLTTPSSTQGSSTPTERTFGPNQLVSTSSGN